jgi:hypothetical protein
VLGFTLGGVSPRTLNGKFYSYEVAQDQKTGNKNHLQLLCQKGKGYSQRARNNKWNLPWPLGQYLYYF